MTKRRKVEKRKIKRKAEKKRRAKTEAVPGQDPLATGKMIWRNFVAWSDSIHCNIFCTK